MNIMIDTPYLSPDEYAKRSGQTASQVTEQCKKGQLPLKERESGGKYMINNALLMKQALDQKW